MTILSIDAWAGFEPKAWDWNAWYAVGEAPNDLANESTRAILAWMRKEGYLSASSAGKVAIEDDECNLVIVDRVTRKPIYALDYTSYTEEA